MQSFNIMNNSKDKIKDYAKTIFIEVNSKGEKKYSLREICTLIAQKYKKNLAPNTIKNWSLEKDVYGNTWIDLYEKIKQAGIEQSKVELCKKENILIDAKADDVAEIYKGSKQLADLARKHLTARLTGQKLKINGSELDVDFENRELLIMLKDSQQVILNLNDKETPSDVNITNNFIKTKIKAIFPTLEELNERLNESNQ